MTQQSHSQTYILRRQKLKETHVAHCSLEHLFTIARTWKQPRCPSTDEWITMLWYVYTMEYYSAIKWNTFELILMRCMNLEPIIQSEVSQKVKDKYSFPTHIYRIQKNGTEEFIYRAAMEKQTQRIDLWTWGGEERVRCMERVTWKLTLPYVKQIASGICCMAQETQTGALYQPRAVGWVMRWVGGSKGRGYMYRYG